MIYPEKPIIKDLKYDEDIEDITKWGAAGAHDPSIFKDDDLYYVFSTDARIGGKATPSIQIRKSYDLIKWEYVGQALDDVPKEAKEWTGAEGVWAPEVTKVNDLYYLYYCASTFGRNRSYIGLLKSKSIDGPWEDNGLVVKSDSGDDRNAIDPNIVFDNNGEMWMSYGSFWTGIYLIKLDKETGKPQKENDKGINIAGRHHSTEGAIEGPYIVYNKEFDKYYLFVSYDSLASDYNVRVGRSESIDGPYIDINGNEMTNKFAVNPNHIGNKILGGYRFGNGEGWIAPGHNSVLNDGEDFYIVHHIRKEYNQSWFYMHVRKILWSNDGWPMISPERYAGEKEQEIDKKLIIGEWELIPLYRDVNRVIVSKTYSFKENGDIEGEYGGKWSFSNINEIKIKIKVRDENEIYKGKVMPSWDWEENKETLIFTTIDRNAVALWGKKVL